MPKLELRGEVSAIFQDIIAQSLHTRFCVRCFKHCYRKYPFYLYSLSDCPYNNLLDNLYATTQVMEALLAVARASDYYAV